MKKEALIDKRETSAPASDTREAYGSRYAYWQVSLAIAVFFLALDFGTKIWAERALRPEW